MSAVWARPAFTPSGAQAWLDLVVFTRDKPALDVDLGEDDGYPGDYALPRSVRVRTASIEEHRDAFESYLAGAFRELAGAQLGEAASAIEEARWAVTVRGSLPDPPDLAHLQAVRAFERFLARTAGAVASANDLSLSWLDLRAFAEGEPPAELRLAEWLEVLYDDEEGALHTRGAAQFARPDLVALGLPDDALEPAARMLRLVARLEADGAVFADGAAVDVEGASVRLAKLDAARCEALALGKDTLLVDGRQDPR